ncbi:MAG: STAS domain-containing protein [Thermodesulfobacteriota bacterium]|nr:STAS domain-containing protein [Thermodesulfobacteriota bacterium]
MAVKRDVNTEPDDAFSAVFGDIDQSPLMRQSGEKAEPETEEREARDREDAAEIPDNGQDPEIFEDQGSEKAEDQEPEEAEVQEQEGFEDQEPEEAEGRDLEKDEVADAPAEESASLEVTEQDGAQTIAPSGDLKGEAAERLMAVLLESLEKDLAHHRLDLEKVGAMDAAGLSVLVYFAEALKSQGREQGLEIINANQDLLNLFSVGRLDKNFAVSLI